MLLTQLSRDKWALVRVQKEGKVILPRFGSSNLFFEPFVFEHILFSNIFCLRTYFVRPIFVDRACKAPHKPPSGVRESCLCEWLSKFYFASVFYIFLFFEVHYTLPHNEHSFFTPFLATIFTSWEKEGQSKHTQMTLEKVLLLVDKTPNWSLLGVEL